MITGLFWLRAKQLVKGIAYAAAYRFYDGDDRSAPDPLLEHWDRYMAELWPDLPDMFATIRRRR